MPLLLTLVIFQVEVAAVPALPEGSHAACSLPIAQELALSAGPEGSHAACSSCALTSLHVETTTTAVLWAPLPQLGCKN